MSPEELWASKYAARFAEERAREEARREEAFLDLPAIVCGEELRVMTPLDLLVLNGIRSPFVCGGEPTPGDIAVFLWWLNVRNDRSHGWFNERRKRKMFRRIAGLNYDETLKAVYGHVDAIFQDAPEGGGGDERRPVGTCFLVPLVMAIAEPTGWAKREIMETPLPQLFQFLKSIRAKAHGKDFIDSAPSDRLRAEFLDDLNAQLNGGN